MEDRENAIVIDELEEAKFIQEWLMKNHGVIVSVEDIMLVTEGQLAYMEKIGLIEPYEGE